MSNRDYRIYDDGTVVNSDDFNEMDNTQPFNVGYIVVSVPDVIVEHIENEVLGK